MNICPHAIRVLEKNQIIGKQNVKKGSDFY